MAKKVDKADKAARKAEKAANRKAALTRLSKSGLPETLPVKVGEQILNGTPMLYKTGSIGYFVTGKVSLQGEDLQVTAHLIVTGSKQ